MTTPERLRRRQRIETALVVVTIALSTGSIVVMDRQNNQQDDCVAKQITDLTNALNTRAEMTRQQTEATAAVIDSFAKAAANPESTDRTGIIRALNNYTKVKDEVAEARERTPFPPFPSGKCDF